MAHKMKASLKPPAQKRETVVIAYVHPGQTSTYFAKSLLMTCMYDRVTHQRVVNVIDDWSSANISSSRNELTRAFLEESDADWLMWIDADMAWDAPAVDQLIDSADPVDRPIVGGLCFGSLHDKLFATIYNFVFVDADGVPVAPGTEGARPTTMRMNDYAKDTLVKCAATGAAFLLIHRSVIQAIKDRGFNQTFPWFQETEGGGLPVGEDLTFCIRAGSCGFPVYVNTSVKIGHHKSTLLTEDMFLAQQS